MNDSKKISRRNLIKNAGLGGYLFTQPFDSLLEAMIKSFIQQSHAEETQQLGSRNYINIGLPGAPLRYQFDHWIRTQNSEPQIVFNPMTSTKLSLINGKYKGVELGYFDYKGTLVPHLFSQQVNTSSGVRKISDLLNNMMIVRGYATGVDGHSANFMRQMSALGGAPSLSGLATDESNAIFDAIQWPARGGFSVFTSSKGKSLTIIPGEKPVHTLLEGFGSQPEKRAAAKKLIDRRTDAFELAKQRLNAYIKSDMPGSKIMAKNQTNALALMKKGISNLDDFWIPTIKRYHTVIETAIRDTGIPGISDQEVLSDVNLMWKIGTGTPLQISPQFDFRNSIKEAVIVNLAEGLALCEYLLKEQLGTCIEISVDNLFNLTLLKNESTTTEKFNLNHDMHETGAGVAVFLMNQFYRGLTAGLLELIEQLQTKKLNSTNLWNETVIQIVSDFGRSARLNGSGSDHGFNQMITSFLSGCIENGPFVGGNVLTSATIGAQGLAASIDGYNQKGAPSPAMAASTLTSLLRLNKNPFVNLAEPLALIENGQLKLKYPGKLKEG